MGWREVGVSRKRQRNLERVPGQFRTTSGLCDQAPTGERQKRYGFSASHSSFCGRTKRHVSEVIELREAFQRGIVEAQNGSLDGSRICHKCPNATSPTRNYPPSGRHRTARASASAIRQWISAGGRGILAMATGSGKTITALAAAERLLEGLGPPLALVIVAPYRHLVDQWIREANRFGLRPIPCSSDNPEWREQLSSAFFAASRGDVPVASAVVTNATFCSRVFQALLETVHIRAMLVADEVHNFGAAHLATALPDKWSIRMGLSATPSRHYDEVGSERIKTYFGDVVARFDIRDALAARPPVLTPYQYHPVPVQLEAGEIDQYMELTDKIARTVRDASDDDMRRDRPCAAGESGLDW